MKPRVLSAIAVFGMYTAVPLHTQQPDSSPRQIAEAFFAAERDGRWVDAARFLDLDVFEHIRRQDVANYRSRPKRSVLTVETLLKYDPSMPREAAEYQVKQANKQSDNFDILAHEFAHVPSVDSLAALPVLTAAAYWLEAKDPRWKMTRDQSRGPQQCQLPPDQLAAIRFPAARIVAVASTAGTGSSLTDVAYVLFRRWPWVDEGPTAVDPGPDIPPNILTLTRQSGKWRIYPVDNDGIFSESFALGCGTGSIQTHSPK